MLLFIYTGKIQNLNTWAVELLKAADIYQLDNLKGLSNFSSLNRFQMNIFSIKKHNLGF